MITAWEFARPLPLIVVPLLALIVSGCAPAAEPDPMAAPATTVAAPVAATTAPASTQLSPVASPTAAAEKTIAPTLTAPVARTVQSDKERITEPDFTWEEQDALVSGNSAFALDFYHRLSDDSDGNLFFSPYSISAALAMTYAGAAGETATQMADALHFDLPPGRLHTVFNGVDLELLKASGDGDDPPELNVANALWGQQGYQFRPEFLDTVAENYGAGLSQLDFTQPDSRQKSAKIINGWVSEETNGKIPTIISPSHFGSCDPPPLDCTRLVLTNAIYFKGKWAEKYEFDERDTEEDFFNLADGGQVKVPMMRQKRELRYAEGDNYQAVQLPYQGHRLAMVIFLPAVGKFDEFADRLDAKTLSGRGDGWNERVVDLTMPRFKLEKSVDAKSALQQLGMIDAFSPLIGVADFSGMADFSSLALPDPGLYISDVLHKAFVEVNEKGTEAAAATAVIMAVPVSEPPTPLPPVVMDVDRPFIFLIRDTRTDAILFLGRVADPSVTG